MAPAGAGAVMATAVVGAAREVEDKEVGSAAWTAEVAVAAVAARMVAGAEVLAKVACAAAEAPEAAVAVAARLGSGEAAVTEVAAGALASGCSVLSEAASHQTTANMRRDRIRNTRCSYKSIEGARRRTSPHTPGGHSPATDSAATQPAEGGAASASSGIGYPFVERQLCRRADTPRGSAYHAVRRQGPCTRG